MGKLPMIAALKGGGVSAGVPRRSRCPPDVVEAPSPEQPVLRSKSAAHIPALDISHSCFNLFGL